MNIPNNPAAPVWDNQIGIPAAPVEIEERKEPALL
jgi:hypothetical protein